MNENTETPKEKKIDLDLDAHVPEPKNIRLGGEIYEIQPPSLEDLLKLTRLGLKLKKAGEDVGAIEIFDEYRKELYKIIPILKNVKLNIAQMFELTDFLGEMSVPQGLKELKKRKIRVDTSQKKSLASPKK